MENRFDRLNRLIGEENLLKLKNSRVAVFGCGGVGGYAIESLARSAIGELHLVDNDVFSITNINRQILAVENTMGRSKVEVAKERVLSINPEINVYTYPLFLLPSTEFPFDLGRMDYVLDCIDTVSAKLYLIASCKEKGVPILSCMGCGNRLDPSQLRIDDIEKTEMDPLAKVIRKKCKDLGLRKVKVLYSLEKPLDPVIKESKEGGGFRKDIPASSAFVPSAAGLLMGSYVVRELLKK
ncbi:MAG: tRNA threonylcarbamoyladenosine dehydratase [Bacilli bacterium]|nr:tRNA threonylcarbamoyladenosine dehydratase [Bacilli bacterium]